jgi:hypothetical protein
MRIDDNGNGGSVMLGTSRSMETPIASLLLVIAISGRMTGVVRAIGPTDDTPKQAKAADRKLSHEETLRWIGDHKAWRLARKTRPIWARQITPEEVGREFQTADHVKEVAGEGFWLCVGVAGEPWFQARERIDAKYEPAEEVRHAFAFDKGPQTYRIFKPRGDSRNWVAQVKGQDIVGFYIRTGSDRERPLYSPSGGYVVKDEVKDPYHDKPDKVWLVQQSLFESTYELLP